MARRFIFIFMTLFLTDTPNLQFISIMLTSLTVQIYLGLSKPKLWRRMNAIELFNESIIYFVTMHLMLFSDYLSNISLRYLCGFSMISMATLTVASTLPFVVITGLRGLYLIAHRYTRKLGYKVGVLK